MKPKKYSLWDDRIVIAWFVVFVCMIGYMFA